MKKVIHLIPYDGTGGVEVAARTAQRVRTAEIDFAVEHIYPRITGYHDRSATFGLRPLFAAYRKLAQQKPDLLIVSLWRAYIVGFLVKLFHPSTVLVLMLHNTKHAHWVDGVITTLTGYVADEWWGDSEATLNQRLKHGAGKTKRVISFVTRRLDPLPAVPLTPTFAFWGRINPQKGIDRAVLLFSEIMQSRPDAKFIVIGPDGGALTAVKKVVSGLALQDSVAFLGEMSMEHIRMAVNGACFYLQTSLYEGMAMSVVEAMQLGLVPVVTPVGEIGRYCHDQENSILIRSIESATEAVLTLLSRPDRFAELRACAIQSWLDKPLYAQSMLDACQSALAIRMKANA